MKVREALNLQRVAQVCYREAKYPEGDKRRDCVYGFRSICDKCYDCKWYQIATDTSLTVTGKHLDKLTAFVGKHSPYKLDGHKNFIPNLKNMKLIPRNGGLTAR